MKEWTKQELLCNARGLDNGYLYVHNSNKLMDKLSGVFKSPDKYTTSKLRITDSSSYGKCGLFGSVRMPLSNEILPVDENVKIGPPSSSAQITRVDADSIFSEPIENAAVCVAFTEASKLPHKSVVLPGAKSPRPVLKNAEDRRIRRPRLNRGGATIANMGVSNGKSHQSGYGSMNISSYERNVAVQTGRGNQMYQAGTRAWGAMEPTPKRRHQEAVQHPVYPSNPFNHDPSQSRQSNRPDGNRPPWQSVGRSQYPQAGPPMLQNRWQPPSNGRVPQQGYSQPGYGYQQQPGQSYSQSQGSYGGGYQQRPPPPPQHSFQSYNRSAPGGYGQSISGYANRPPQHQNQPPSRVDQNRMNDLRSQLASTLNQNRRRQGQNHGHQS